MTGTEVLQFGAIVLCLAVSYWWFWTWTDRAQRNALVKLGSAEYPVARTGSMLIPSMDPFVVKGSTIYIPSSDGLYHTIIRKGLARQYVTGLTSWLEKGATVHVFVTRPNERCLAEWKACANEASNFYLHFLNRSQTTSQEIKDQIEKLDTFHPVLLVLPPGGDYPGAMWIEGFHPVGSKYAYNVEFRNPADTARDVRFRKYRTMYERLLKEPTAPAMYEPQEGAPKIHATPQPAEA
jgi:hypothetical protein